MRSIKWRCFRWPHDQRYRRI